MDTPKNEEISDNNLPVDNSRSSGIAGLVAILIVCEILTGCKSTVGKEARFEFAMESPVDFRLTLELIFENEPVESKVPESIIIYGDVGNTFPPDTPPQFDKS